ncbi:uncharacterized protein LOC127860556 [Dreissena polymorpha]|uniref:uncharacterized protein LOC127860556 n=1 Tax=Dreissena polymorpha TaxID=45954 RepID=UPI00226419F7|nr:uncharacterized protein LOC127860556 [Dreissena polymorpha]XP_052254638.1 uncharacterized protein LOC127860556 [Dreissena polymorpha]
MKQIIGFAGFGLACLNGLFSILALALNVWMESDHENQDGGYASYGLFKYCGKFSQGYVCNEIPPVGQVLAARGFVALGMILMLGAAVTAGVRVFFLKDKNILYLVTVGLSIAAGFCLLIGFATYVSFFGHYVSTGSFRYGGGFALCVIAWLFSWIQAGVFFVHGRMPDSPA